MGDWRAKLEGASHWKSAAQPRWTWRAMFHRRDGWLYYRKVIAPHLRSFFDNKTEVIVSLRTKDEKVGRERLLEVSLDTEKKLARAKELYKAMVASPEAIASEWKYTALRGYAADRDRIVRERTPDAQLDDATLEAEVSALQSAVADHRKALAKGDLSVVQDVLRVVLNRHGVTLKPAEERQLAHELLRARIEAQEVALDRALGNWRDVPKPVLSPTITQVVDRWLAERVPPRQTAHEVKAMLARFLKANGRADLDVTKLGKPEVRAFREALLAPDAKTGKGKGTLAPATVRKNLTLLGTVLSYAVRTGLIEANPASGMAFVPRGKTQNLEKRRLPFSDEAARVFLANLDTQSDTMQRIGRILFFSGARLAEVGNARGTDVEEREGVWGLSIAPSDSTSVKSPTSVRFVPLHSEILKTDLLALAKERGSGFLFPDLSPNGHGKRTSALSKAFARYLRRLKLDQGGRVVMHSARHTVATKLRAAGVAEDVRDQILGHAGIGGQGRRYGSPHPPATLKKAIETIGY